MSSFSATLPCLLDWRRWEWRAKWDSSSWTIRVTRSSSLAISREQLDALHRDCGFCWNDIARILRVSNRTLRRRRHEFGMRVVGREFSNISDTEIDNLVRQVQEVTPSAGLRMVQGSLRERGLVVQRMHVLLSLRRVDPVTTTLRNARRIIRRSYNVPCPNSLW